MENEDNLNIYSQLGVSSKKEDVRKAIKLIDKGLYPGAFCKIVDDVAGRKDYCSIFHADGAGTKASLAYMYYKETGDVSVFKGIVQDAIVMNIDDILCVGATGNYFLSNNIGRNSKYIPFEIVATIINEYEIFCINMVEYDLNIVFCGGETADIGDLVRTLVVDASVFTTMKKNDVIDASKIQVGDVIIGFASYGKASYENEYNSGIGSNGLTLARHGLFSEEYRKKYPECYDPSIDKKLVFFGKYKLLDKVPGMNFSIGKALLSPTRTYAPVLMKILRDYREHINGIIHNTGGGQTKIINFGKGIKFLKNNLFQTPKIFRVIQQSSETQWREMFQVFNMGHRMEVICEESASKSIMNIAKKFQIDSRIIGHCERSLKREKNELEIRTEYGIFKYNQ